MLIADLVRRALATCVTDDEGSKDGVTTYLAHVYKKAFDDQVAAEARFGALRVLLPMVAIVYVVLSIVFFGSIHTRAKSAAALVASSFARMR